MVNKKGVVGIGTLIVFIATILVAAVAAGVLIRTSGVLQEKAFAVAGEARTRLVTGVEIFQVYGTSDFTGENPRIPLIELLIRSRSGSGPVQMKHLGFTFSTQDTSFSASLQNDVMESFTLNMSDYNTTFDGNWTNLGLDLNGDLVDDSVRLVVGSDGLAALEFNVTYLPTTVEVPLGFNLTSATIRNVTVSEAKITLDEQIYGYVDVSLQLTAGDTSTALTLSNTNTVVIKEFPEINACHFNLLIPERYYCFETRIGDGDSVLEAGELFVIRFKLTATNAIEEEDEFYINVLPKDGAISYLEASAPAVIGDRQIVLWPR